MAGFRVIVRRTGETVDRERYDSLGQALAAVERAVEASLRGARRETARAFVREIEPGAQVAARIEVAGPGGARGGVDVRGDGSAEAFTGRWRRETVETRPGEDAVAALRRALS